MAANFDSDEKGCLWIVFFIFIMGIVIGANL